MIFPRPSRPTAFIDSTFFTCYEPKSPPTLWRRKRKVVVVLLLEIHTFPSTQFSSKQKCWIDRLEETVSRLGTRKRRTRQRRQTGRVSPLSQKAPKPNQTGQLQSSRHASSSTWEFDWSLIPVMRRRQAGHSCPTLLCLEWSRAVSPGHCREESVVLGA